MKNLLIGLALVVSAIQLSAQELDHGLAMISKSDGEVIKLRWAPTTWLSWKQVIEGGVNIDRHVIRRNGALLPLTERSQTTRLNGEPVRPWQDQEEWRVLSETDDYAAIGAQAIFGQTFQVVAEDQGGQSSLIDRARDQQNRFSFGLFAADHSYNAALAMGLAFIDSSALANEVYVYQVVPAELGRTLIDTGFTSCSLDEVEPLPKIIDASIAFETDQAILVWDKQQSDNTYVSYTVERSLDGVSFAPVHDKPIVNPQQMDGDDRYMMYVDTLPSNGIPLYYRIVGNTSFNEQGPPSDVLSGIGFERLPFSYPVIESVLPYESADQLGISWSYEKLEEELIVGFYIYRADNVDGPYELLNPNDLMAPNLRFFVDQEPFATNYYKVAGIDQYDREVESYPALAQLVDEIPPAAPANVRGKIMEDGTMVMTWDENQEIDLLGYRVWMSNDSTDEFTQLTNKVHPRNVFLDETSLNTLSREVYIKVAAYDYRQNMSVFSDMATLYRPDTIPPSAPVIQNIVFENEMVEINWVGSSSVDVVGHELWHRSADSTWELLQNLDPSEEKLMVSIYQPGAGNYYQIRAVDQGGLSSSSQEVSIYADLVGGVPSPWNVRGTADRRAKTVILEWEYVPEAEISHFVIFRADGEEPIKTHQLVAANDLKIDHRRKAIFRYKDDSVQMNSHYQYAVRAVLMNEKQSSSSEAIQILY